jgi:hypothetical protein
MEGFRPHFVRDYRRGNLPRMPAAGRGLLGGFAGVVPRILKAQVTVLPGYGKRPVLCVRLSRKPAFL